jgi:hypothetical protein
MRYERPIIAEGESVTTRRELMDHYAAFLKVEEARLLNHHRQTLEGFLICRERTDLIDHVVTLP